MHGVPVSFGDRQDEAASSRPRRTNRSRLPRSRDRSGTAEDQHGRR